MSDRSIEEQFGGHPARHPSGLSPENLGKTQWAIEVAKWSLQGSWDEQQQKYPRSKLHLWDTDDHSLRQIDVHRFITEQIRFNTDTDDHEIDYCVDESALNDTTDAEKRALYNYCVDNFIDEPRALKLFMRNVGKEPNIRSEKTVAKKRAMYAAVKEVVYWTDLLATRYIAHNQKRSDLVIVDCAVDAVVEALRELIGPHVKAKYDTVEDAYEELDRLVK